MSSTADSVARRADLALERPQHTLLDPRREPRAEVLEATRDVLLEVGSRCVSAPRAGLPALRDGNLGGFGALEPVDRDLEDALGLVDPAEMALPEREHGDAVGQPGAEQGARRLREEDLTAAPIVQMRAARTTSSPT